MTPLEIAKEIIGTSEDSRTWHQITIDCAELIKEYATEQIKKDRERLLDNKSYADIQGHGIIDFVELCHFDQPITLD